jgi:hypothetical protein
MKNSFPKIIGAGCPRSGTMFLADLLTQGGLPMGHETYFGNPNGGTWIDGMVGDVSWLSAPFLHEYKGKDRVIIQIVREPIAHINSLIMSDFFEEHSFRGNTGTRFVELYLPQIRLFGLLDRYIYFWTKWNQMIEPYADFIYRLEDLSKNPSEIFEDLKHDIGDKVVKLRKVNAHKHKNTGLTQEDFKKCELYGDLIQGMHHYKYEYDKGIKGVVKSEVIIK